MSGDLIINVCPTGMVPTKERVPDLPVTPEEIGNDARRCFEAGASMIHLHARDENAQPTWTRERFSQVVAAVEAEAPQLVIVVTTSGRSWGDFERRSASLSAVGIDARPEMASLTLGSMNFPRSASVNDPAMIRRLAGAMQAKGLKPELEVFDVGMAEMVAVLAGESLLSAPYYVNVLLGSSGTAGLSAANLAAVLAALPDTTTWALAGIGRNQAAAHAVALALGGHVRVGLEDNPYFDWSTRRPTSNPALVERTVRLAAELGRSPADPATVRSMIGLPVPGRLARQ